jgi:hypothetical protein
MRIALIGGVERNERQYREIAERFGHQLWFHDGHMGGRSAEILWRLVAGVDYVIIQTDVNSHGAVHVARRAARRSGAAVVLYRRVSPNRLAAIAAGFSARAQAGAA